MTFMELMAVSYHFQSRFNLKQRFIRSVIDTGDSVNIHMSVGGSGGVSIIIRINNHDRIAVFEENTLQCGAAEFLEVIRFTFKFHVFRLQPVLFITLCNLKQKISTLKKKKKKK